MKHLRLFGAILLLQLTSFNLIGAQSTPSGTACTLKMDLCFVLDGSGSICDNDQVTTCDNWKAALQFVANIISHLTIGYDDTRVSVIIFQSTAYGLWNLTSYSNKADLLNAVQNIAYPGGSTDTVGALNLLVDLVFTAAGGSRPEVPHNAIIITDGRPWKGGDVPSDQVQAAANRVHNNGIRTFVVGVGNDVDFYTLSILSSPPQQMNVTYFWIRTFTDFNIIESQLANVTCSTPTPACTLQIDLVFCVDGSGSICDDYGVATCDNWKSVTNFMHQIVSAFTIGPNDIRIAALIFQSTSYIVWNFTTYENNKPGLLNAVDNLVYPGGTTDTVSALNLLVDGVFTQSGGTRQSATHTAIIITDGKPNRDSGPIPTSEVQAAIDRVHNSGIRTLAVGVGDAVDYPVLQMLSSPPQEMNKTYFWVKSFSAIQGVQAQLQNQTCQLPYVPSPATPSPVTGGNLICNGTKMDICFVVDRSGSICDSDENFDYEHSQGGCSNWDFILQSIVDLVQGMTISSDYARVGMVIFATNARVEFNLGAYTDINALTRAIQSIPYVKGGTTDLTDGLNLMRTQCFGTSNDRSEVPNTGIVITDGYPTNPSTLQGAIDALRTSGIRVLCVGVTNKVDFSTLRRVSSPPHQMDDTWFYATDYSTIKDISEKIGNQACDPYVPSPNSQTTNSAPPQVICDENKMDLCFVDDASGSICDSDESWDYADSGPCQNWLHNTQFIVDLVQRMKIGPDDTRVGMVVFATNSRVEFNLGTYMDKNSLVQAILNITYKKGGTTDMTGGLQLMRTQCFGANDDRPGVPNKAIVITDGYPTSPSTLQAEINAVNAADIQVFCVGVTGDVDISTLQRVSSEPHKINVTYFLAKDYASVSQAVSDQLIEQTCGTSPQPNPDPIGRSTIPSGNECGEVIDLCFVIDQSGSICDSDPDFDYYQDSTCQNWKDIIDFLIAFIKDLTISPSVVKIGLVTFSDVAQVVWNLNRYQDETSVENAISGLEYHKGGTTNMTGALYLMRTEVFNAVGARPNVPKKVVIITDGLPTDPTNLQNEIDAAQNSGIQLFSIGVTNKIDQNTLARLSSPPHKINETYFKSLDFSQLQYLRQLVLQRIC